MRPPHGPAEKLFVDFAGDTVPVFDADTGTQRLAHLFVAVLGASNYTFAEARWSEGLPDWIGLQVNAFAAIGGVPKAIVCDNLTAGHLSLRAGRQSHLPGAGRALRHRDPAHARVRKPRDKAKVEVAVQIVQRFVLARLRTGASSRFTNSMQRSARRSPTSTQDHARARREPRRTVRRALPCVPNLCKARAGGRG
jgi:transposase